MSLNQGIIRNAQKENVGFLVDWYTSNEPILSTNIKEKDFERVEEFLKSNGLSLDDTTYVSYPNSYDTNTFLWNDGAIIYCQRKKESSVEPTILANNQGIIVNQELNLFIAEPTRIITIVSKHKEKIRNTAYRLKLPF